MTIPSLLLTLALPAQVTFESKPGQVAVALAGKPFAILMHGSEWAKPFLYDIRAASGTVVTRAYPMKQVPGEVQDHPWHHGLWWAHGDVNGVDFWRDKGPELTGRLVMAGPPETKGGRLSFETRMSAPGGGILGSVRQSFTFAGRGDKRWIDARIEILANRGVALKFGDTEEGTLGLRLADPFREERGAVMTNSAGAVGRRIWGQRARWVDYSAAVGQEALGVIVFDHPGNPKHPTYWHARPYSLNAANPFGEHDFMKDPKRDGSLTVPAGGSLVFRYRILIHAGMLDGIQPDALFAEFAAEK